MIIQRCSNSINQSTYTSPPIGARHKRLPTTVIIFSATPCAITIRILVLFRVMRAISHRGAGSTLRSRKTPTRLSMINCRVWLMLITMSATRFLFLGTECQQCLLNQYTKDTNRPRARSSQTLKNKKVRSVTFGLSAVWTRLELATPCVTGRYSNQLNYHTVLRCLQVQM